MWQGSHWQLSDQQCAVHVIHCYGTRGAVVKSIDLPRNDESHACTDYGYSLETCFILT